MSDARTNLLGLTPVQLVEYCKTLNEKPFRAKQLQRWIHQSGVSDFAEMTDLAKSLRGKLEGCAEVKAPKVLKDHLSADGRGNGCSMLARAMRSRQSIFLKITVELSAFRHRRDVPSIVCFVQQANRDSAVI